MKRTIALADVHGHNCTLQNLLFEKIKLQKDDRLYILGDIQDRGDDTCGVIETILKLLRNGYDVRLTLGNHEHMLLQALNSRNKRDLNYWLENGGIPTLVSYYDAFKPEDIPVEHIRFLKGLPLYHITDTHVFVHGGLDFSLNDPFSPAGEAAMLWQREMVVNQDKIGGRKLVVGHTVKNLDEIVASLETNLITLDNGCFLGEGHQGVGNLVALEINSGELFIQENIG